MTSRKERCAIIGVVNEEMKPQKRESIFLSEDFMAITCILIAGASIISLILFRSEMDYYMFFELVTKLVTTVAMFFAFKFYKWDVAKGLMGGVLFCLMYQEAYLVLGKLWGEEDFDTYLVVGIQGSLYLAAAGMSFLMTVIITINHFFINHTTHGNPKNVTLNRIAILFKFAVYILLLVSNSRLGFSRTLLWRNVLQYFTDMVIILLLVSMESQFDSFKLLRQELLKARRERKKDQ